jgi:hypothetical protein
MEWDMKLLEEFDTHFPPNSGVSMVWTVYKLQTTILTEVFVIFLSFRKDMLGEYMKSNHCLFFPRPFQLYTNHPVIRRSIGRVTDGVSK